MMKHSKVAVFNPHEKVYIILDLIACSSRISQRDMAVRAGLSLGLVNLTLKRLARTGYIKVSNLNHKRVQYFLTAKGATEKARRAYSYLSRTVQVFKEYRARMKQIIQELVDKGGRRFAIIGDGEVLSLMEMILHSFGPEVNYRLIDRPDQALEGEIVLDCRLNGRTNGNVGVSVLSRLLSVAAPSNGHPSYSI